MFLGRCQNRCRRCLRAGTSVSEEEAMGGYGRQVHYDRCFEGHDLSAAKLKYLITEVII